MHRFLLVPDARAMSKRTPLLLIPLVLAGCGDSSPSAERSTGAVATTPTATAPSTGSTRPVSPRPTSLVVYRLHGGKLAPERVSVPSTTGVAAASLGALDLAAPVTIVGGTARVERDGSTLGEVAEIVYTLTRYPTIRRVDVAGRTALTRPDVEKFAPPILIESPLPGDSFDGRVRGTASVFEATLVVELAQDDKVLVRQTVTASEGAPGRGAFDATLNAPHVVGPAVTLVAYSPSAADGSEQHRVAVPVELAP